MRGPRPAYPIALTAEEAKHLQHLIRAHTTLEHSLFLDQVASKAVK